MSESSTTLNASASKDAVVERCVQFFSLDKINAAIDKFEKSLSQRLSKRNKSDNLQVQLVTDLYDKMWLLDSNSTPLPTFIAADFSRVPQDKKEVGNNNDSLASTEQLLASILSLKSIVRDLQSKMVTHETLDASLAKFRGNSSSSSSLPAPPSTPNGSRPEETLSAGQPGVNGIPGSPPPIFSQSQGHPEEEVANVAVAAPTAPPPLQPTPFLDPVQHQRGRSKQASNSGVRRDSSNRGTSSSNCGANSSHRGANPSHRSANSKNRGANSNNRGADPSNFGAISKLGVNRSHGSSLIIGQNVSAGIISFKGADLTVARYVGRVDIAVTSDDIKQHLESKNIQVVSRKDKD